MSKLVSRISTVKFNELLQRANKKDEQAIEMLYKNYYCYVDFIVSSWPDGETKPLVRVLAEKELMKKINDYFDKKLKSDLSNYLFNIIRNFNTRLCNYQDGLAYLMRNFPAERDGLQDKLVSSLMPTVIEYLKKNNLTGNINAKLSCIMAMKEMINEIMNKPNKDKKAEYNTKKWLMCRLEKLKIRDLTGFDKTFDVKGNGVMRLDLLAQKYSYIIEYVIRRYHGYLDDETLRKMVTKKYYYYINTLANEADESKIKHYLNCYLNSYLRSLNMKGQKLVKDYVIKGAKTFVKLNQKIAPEDMPAFIDYFKNTIIFYVKSGAYKSEKLEHYLIISTLRFAPKVANTAQTIKESYEAGFYNVLDMEKRRRV